MSLKANKLYNFIKHNIVTTFFLWHFEKNTSVTMTFQVSLQNLRYSWEKCIVKKQGMNIYGIDEVTEEIIKNCINNGNELVIDTTSLSITQIQKMNSIINVFLDSRRVYDKCDNYCIIYFLLVIVFCFLKKILTFLKVYIILYIIN